MKSTGTKTTLRRRTVAGRDAAEIHKDMQQAFAGGNKRQFTELMTEAGKRDAALTRQLTSKLKLIESLRGETMAASAAPKRGNAKPATTASRGKTPGIKVTGKTPARATTAARGKATGIKVGKPGGRATTASKGIRKPAAAKATRASAGSRAKTTIAGKAKPKAAARTTTAGRRSATVADPKTTTAGRRTASRSRARPVAEQPTTAASQSSEPPAASDSFATGQVAAAE